jgi:hypothetical protein
MAAKDDEFFGAGWATVAQVSRRLGRSRKYVYRLIRDEHVRTQNVAGKLYVDAFDVETIARQFGLAPVGEDPEQSYGRPDDESEQESPMRRAMRNGSGFREMFLDEMRRRGG